MYLFIYFTFLVTEKHHTIGTNKPIKTNDLVWFVLHFN